MLEHMKKPLIEIKYKGPKKNIDKLTKYAQKLSFKKVEKNSDFLKELFPELKNANIPSYLLRGARVKEDVTQKELAKLTGISQGNISEMENGKRAIGVATAKKLGKALNIGYKVFL